MMKEPLKLKILRKIGLTTVRHARELLYDQMLKHHEQEQEINTQKYKEIYEIEINYKKALKEKEIEINTLKNLYEKHKIKLEDKIVMLKSENGMLQNELKSMHKKYDGKMILEKLPPVKLKKSDMQTMKVSNRNALRSRIARNSVKEVEKVN